MSYETIEYAVDDNGVARLTLARPEVKNAMNGVMYDEARAVVAEADRDPAVRVLVLTGQGNVFCAGGDFKYQQSQAKRPHSERIAEASKLALWLRELDCLSKPLVGRIQGGAFGGGLGLVSVCDIAVATTTAKFCLTEVSIGMAPSMISPFVVRKMGVPKARRYMLNAEPFSAEEALAMNVVQFVTEPDALDAAVDTQVARFLNCAPGAVAMTKRLIAFVSTQSDSDTFQYTVDRVAEMWSSAEAEEGMRSFFEKRPAAWVRRAS